MSGRGDYVGEFERRRDDARRHEARNVRHVSHQVGAALKNFGFFVFKIFVLFSFSFNRFRLDFSTTKNTLSAIFLNRA